MNRKGSLDGSNDPKVGFLQEVRSEGECILVETSALIQLHIKALRTHSTAVFCKKATIRFVQMLTFYFWRWSCPSAPSTPSSPEFLMPTTAASPFPRGQEQRDVIHLQKCPVGAGAKAHRCECHRVRVSSLTQSVVS